MRSGKQHHIQVHVIYGFAFPDRSFFVAIAATARFARSENNDYAPVCYLVALLSEGGRSLMNVVMETASLHAMTKRPPVWSVPVPQPDHG